MFTAVSTLRTILSSMRIPCENYANAFVSCRGKVFTVDRSASKDYLLNGLLKYEQAKPQGLRRISRWLDAGKITPRFTEYAGCTRDYVRNNALQLLNCNLTHSHHGPLKGPFEGIRGVQLAAGPHHHLLCYHQCYLAFYILHNRGKK